MVLKLCQRRWMLLVRIDSLPVQTTPPPPLFGRRYTRHIFLSSISNLCSIFRIGWANVTSCETTFKVSAEAAVPNMKIKCLHTKNTKIAILSSISSAKSRTHSNQMLVDQTKWFKIANNLHLSPTTIQAINIH